MSNQIVPYNHDSRQPQSFEWNGFLFTADLDENGDPRFIASDVCKILELSNVSQALARLDDDEKGITIVYTPGGTQDVLTVNQSGLFHLTFTSRKKEAKEFRKYVTSVVLPSILKNGGYIARSMAPDEILVMLAQQNVDMRKRQEATERETAELREQTAQNAIAIEDIHEELLDRDYYTVLQWCQRQHIVNTPALRQMWGKAAKAASVARNIEIKDTNEGLYNVGRYHKSVLLDVCVARPKSNGQMSLLGGNK